jgi:hypothetical protein
MQNSDEKGTKGNNVVQGPSPSFITLDTNVDALDVIIASLLHSLLLRAGEKLH